MKNFYQHRNLILALAIILAFGVITRSIFSHYSLEREKIKARQSAFMKNKSTVKKWKSLKGEYENLKLSFLRGDTLAFKKTVEEQARDAGVDITSLSIASEDKKYYWEAVMELEAVCPYNSLKSFVSSIEKKSIETRKLEIRGDEENVKVGASLKGVIIK